VASLTVLNGLVVNFEICEMTSHARRTSMIISKTVRRIDVLLVAIVVSQKLNYMKHRMIDTRPGKNGKRRGGTVGSHLHDYC
jgi:hypothetical protein